jgi:hypothetical protein
MTKSKAIMKVGQIQQRILLVRGEKVIIDADLAEAYGVSTKALNQAIRRNADRFPSDFMFRLTKEEKQERTSTRHEGLLRSCVFHHAFV